jgi:hypothetical protein
VAKKVKSIKDLKELVKNDIEKKIKSDSAQMKLKDVNRQSVINEVYKKYRPKQYIRRGDNRGLSDRRNINVVPVKIPDGVLILLYNTTIPTGYDSYGMENEFLTPIIENGLPNPEGPWDMPRPFMEDTEDKLMSGDTIKNIIKEIGYIK